MSGYKIKIFGLPVFEKRGTTIQTADSYLLDLQNRISGGLSATGVAVNTNNALTVSTVFACGRVLANAFSILPFSPFKILENGDREMQRNHPLFKLFHLQPNPAMTAFNFKHTLQLHLAYHGNAYCVIERNNRQETVALWPVDPGKVTAVLNDGRLWYKIEGQKAMIPDYDMFHLKVFSTDGITGKSPIAYARDSIGSAIAMEKYKGGIYKAGGSKKMALVSPQRLNPDTKKNLKDSWKSENGGVDNLGEIPILEGGLDVKEIGMSPEDAKFVETGSFTVEEIVRFFGVPLHMVQHHSRGISYNNVEQLGIDFVTHTMMPYFVAWENEADVKLLRESEKASTYMKVNASALLRGDAKSRAEYLRIMFYAGSINRNEWRALEELNAVPDGEKFYMQSNMIPAEDAGAKYKDTKKPVEQK